MQKAVWHIARVAHIALVISFIFVIGAVGVGESTAASAVANTAKEQTTEYDLSEPKMSCAEAGKITRRALERLHYKVTDAPQPLADTGGDITGIRLGGRWWLMFNA